MAAWTKDKLQKFAAENEPHVSPLRDDGVSYAKPIPIWAVVVDDALFARAFRGSTAHWYRMALRQKAGRISAAGTTMDVTFELAGGAINDRIDEAYRAKYGSSPYLASMLAEDIRATTLRIMPRSGNN